MRLGFYLTGTQPVERVLPLIARAALGQDQRLLVVSTDEAQLQAIDRALWELSPESFLAHGMAGQAGSDRQPVLLSLHCEAANGAKLIALADGTWREEAEGFERALLFFADDQRAAARETWRIFDGRDDVTREFFELENGKWVKRA